MRSVINQTLVAESLIEYPDGMLPITVVGNSSTFNGQRLRYFEDALASQPLNITLNIGRALGGTRKMNRRGASGESLRRGIQRR